MDKLQHRKAARRLVIKDAQGNVVTNRSVHAKLINHKFIFACGAFFTAPMLDPTAPEELREHFRGYWESWKELFNLGVLPFYQGRYEPVQGQTQEESTLRAAKFLQENGRKVKGHPLCWHTVDARWLMDMSNEEVLENQKFRIRREMTAFKDIITVWDVINEVVIMPVFDKTENAITRLCQHMGRIPLIKALFEQARAVDPNATLLINDFNTSEKYRQMIQELIEAGCTPDVIGIQSHQHQGFWGMDKLHEVLERFSVFGLPLHFTENTFVSGDLMPAHIVDLNDWQVPSWPTTPTGEERQARDLERMIDTLFAHPLVTAFTNWDFTDGAWLGAPAGLVRLDGSRKPSFDLLRQRIRSDWHTRLTLTTDENGCCRVEGFRGEYTLECGKEKASFTLRADCPAQTVVLAP